MFLSLHQSRSRKVTRGKESEPQRLSEKPWKLFREPPGRGSCLVLRVRTKPAGVTDRPGATCPGVGGQDEKVCSGGKDSRRISREREFAVGLGGGGK